MSLTLAIGLAFYFVVGIAVVVILVSNGGRRP